MALFNCFIFSLLIIGLVLYGLWNSKAIKTENSYLLAKRELKFFPLMTSLVMTEFNTASLLAFSSMGYLASWWGFSLCSIFLIGLLFYAFAVAKKWKQFNGVSVAHFFSERYNQTTGRIVAIILYCAMIGFSAVYLRSLTLLFKPLFPHLSIWIISAFITLLVMAMVFRGGLVSIIRIDIISFCLMLLMLPWLIYFAEKLPTISHAIPPSLSQMQAHLPIKFVVSLVILTMFSNIAAPWYGQKVVAAKTPRIAKQAVFSAACVISLFYAIGICSTALLRQKGVVLHNADMAIPYLIMNALPPLTHGLAYGLLFTIGATTLSGVWNAMSTILIGKLSQAASLKRSYSFSFISIIACYLVANISSDNLLNSMILANIPVVAISFALLAGFYWCKATQYAAYASIIIGIIWGCFCYWHYGIARLYTWHWAIVGVPLIFITGIVTTQLTLLWKNHRP